MAEVERFILDWKGKVKQCYEKNYPWNCPRGSFELKTRAYSGGGLPKLKTRSISYCKFFSYCHRKFQKKNKVVH